MAAPTQVASVVSNGDGTTSTVTIAMPAAADAAGIVQTISRVGFWDTARANYYPPAAVRKITPQ